MHDIIYQNRTYKWEILFSRMFQHRKNYEINLHKLSGRFYQPSYPMKREIHYLTLIK